MKAYLIAVVSFFCAHAFGAVPVPIDGTPIVTYANKHLSQCGALKKTSDGFVYLKVSQRYIDDLFPLLQAQLSPADAEKLCKPPYVGEGKIGAHVSVIYASELPKPITSFPENGRKECFTVSGFAYVDPEQGPFQRVYYLRLLSADLSKIRVNYRLSPLYNNHDFHISIAVVYREES